MSWNTGSVAAYAYELVDSVPEGISGASMRRMAELCVRRIENYTGESIGLDSISSDYHSLLANMTAVYTLSRMHGVGVDFNFSLGRFKVDKSGKGRPEMNQISTLVDSVNSELSTVGIKMGHKMSYG